MGDNPPEQLPWDTVCQQLRVHVFGESGPTACLLNEGQFPNGWIEEYSRLLQVVVVEWQDKPMWPREVVSAIHFTSWYLELRYNAWGTCTGNRNECTERELASLRSKSELFLMRGSLIESQ
jgi:hypothetical protein